MSFFKPEVSILISIYNESEKFIKESLDSLIRQSFHDFEIILILDNPLRSDVEDIVESFKDDRIKLFINTSNIGLAESMNRAASLASSNIYVRMDADDIAYPERIKKEYEIINTGKYDFVFSRFDYIDIESRVLDREPPICYDDNNVVYGILSHHIVHHPTVMMTKDIFHRVGGYRDFPCSQDSDLWYRMILAGCRFHMMPDILLHYRINPNGISQTIRFKQWLTNYYINKLFVERIKYGNDSYSISKYNEFLERKGVNNENNRSKFDYYLTLLEKSKNYDIIRETLVRIWVFIKYPLFRKNFLLNKRKVLLFKNLS